MGSDNGGDSPPASATARFSLLAVIAAFLCGGLAAALLVSSGAVGGGGGGAAAVTRDGIGSGQLSPHVAEAVLEDRVSADLRDEFARQDQEALDKKKEMLRAQAEVMDAAAAQAAQLERKRHQLQERLRRPPPKRWQPPAAAAANISTNFADKVGVVAIFKEEAAYVGDWLEYHALLGVDRFWLYSNECDEAQRARTDKVLAPYIARGLVVLNTKYACDKRFQRAAYNAALQHVASSRAVQWLGVFDLDEYFVLEDPHVSIPQLLGKHEADKVAGVAFWRLTYGPSDHVESPAASVLAAYTRHAHPFKRRGSQVKMWVRTDKCTHLQIHGCDAAQPGYSMVSTSGEPFNYYVRGKIRYPRFFDFSGGWFNHYYTRSLRDFIAKNNRGDAQYEKRLASRVRLPEGMDDVFDTAIMDVVNTHTAALPDQDRATQLRAQLLRGAASSKQLDAWTRHYTQHGAVWNEALRREGMAKQKGGEWPLRRVPDAVVPVLRPPGDNEEARSAALAELAAQAAELSASRSRGRTGVGGGAPPTPSTVFGEGGLRTGAQSAKPRQRPDAPPAGDAAGAGGDGGSPLVPVQEAFRMWKGRGGGGSGTKRNGQW